MSEKNRLKKLCGLAPNALADVFENNPRAYMAVKGAVAEKHLEFYFQNLKKQKKILDFSGASSDSDKDFLISLLNGQEIIVECKNIEVRKLSKKGDYLNYLKYLQQREGVFQDFVLSSSEAYHKKDVEKLFKSLPQHLRESGLPRYEFSASQLRYPSVKDGISAKAFIEQFDDHPLKIDFQRTRNSREIEGEANNRKSARFYKIDEIHIVAACLFSRTMNWEFLFGNQTALPRHENHPERFHPGLKLLPDFWHFEFLDAV